MKQKLQKRVGREWTGIQEPRCADIWTPELSFWTEPIPFHLFCKENVSTTFWAWLLKWHMFRTFVTVSLYEVSARLFRPGASLFSTNLLAKPATQGPRLYSRILYNTAVFYAHSDTDRQAAKNYQEDANDKQVATGISNLTSHPLRGAATWRTEWHDP